MIIILWLRENEKYNHSLLIMVLTMKSSTIWLGK